MQLELNATELEVLQRVLTHYLPNLREEVYKTEDHDWREFLKRDEVAVKAMIAQLERMTSGDTQRAWPIS